VLGRGCDGGRENQGVGRRTARPSIVAAAPADLRKARLRVQRSRTSIVGGDFENEAGCAEPCDFFEERRQQLCRDGPLAPLGDDAQRKDLALVQDHPGQRKSGRLVGGQRDQGEGARGEERGHLHLAPRLREAAAMQRRKNRGMNGADADDADGADGPGECRISGSPAHVVFAQPVCGARR
jgi:hypothetical protein